MQQDVGPIRVEPPGLQVPIALILDDPAPRRNAMYFHGGFRGHVAEIPNTFLAAFADMAERTGMSGKFTLLPYPFGLGRIDRSLTGIADYELAEFLTIVRDRIAPRFDISSEILTHWNALDLNSMALLPWWEREWVSWQSRETLTSYIGFSLEILQNVRIPANGVTSPWDTGATNEEDYAWAIGDAARRINGQPFTWYFLHNDERSAFVAPRLWHPNRQQGTAVVSIITCSGDALWKTQAGEPAELDRWITADGSGGRLVEAGRPGGILAFCTHWQSLFSNGSWAGLRALEKVARRVNMHLGKKTRWMRCSEIARYATTTACLHVESYAVAQNNLEFHLRAPLPCDGYTISIPADNRSPARITIHYAHTRIDLNHAASPVDRLPPGTWTVQDERIMLCWNFQGNDSISIQFL